MHLLLSGPAASTGVYSVTKIEGLAVIDSRTSTGSVENLGQSQKSEGASSNSGDRWHILRLCRQKQQRFAIKNQSNSKSWRSSSAIRDGLSILEAGRTVAQIGRSNRMLRFRKNKSESAGGHSRYGWYVLVAGSLAGAAVSLTRHVLADSVAEREAERQDCKCYSYVRHVPPSTARLQLTCDRTLRRKIKSVG
jgi:hypothetical protein